MVKEWGLTPEEIEKLAEDTAIHWGKVMIPLQEQRESQQALISFKAGMEAQLAKLTAVPLDEKMVHNCNKIIAKFLRDFDNEAHQYPIPILTQLLLSQLSIYCNAKEIRAWKEIFQTYDEYIALLTDELTELAGIASVHGWITSRFEQGKICRTKIKALKGEHE